MVKLSQTQQRCRKLFQLLISGFILFVIDLNLVSAEDSTLGGHFKTQASFLRYSKQDLAAALGSKNAQRYTSDIRLNSQTSFQTGRFVLEAEHLGLGGKYLNTQRKILSLPTLSKNTYLGDILPTDNSQLLDLATETSDDEDFISALRLDRLYFTSDIENLHLSLGRQAISWGNALSFQALDMFNPFSPSDIDKDYKRGDDLALISYQATSEIDVHFLAIPRRDTSSTDIKADQSSFIGRVHARLEELDADGEVLMGQHYNQNVLGFGFAKGISGAIWRFDFSAVPEKLAQKEYLLVTGIDRSWLLLSKNFYTYLEYFRSGFGNSNPTLDQISEPLAERLTRGELFTLGRDYLSTGLRLEAHPLWNIYLSSILNLNEQSGLIQIKNSIDISTDFQALVGLNMPFGGNDSEFGGLKINENTYLSSGTEAYLKLEYYY